MQQPQNWHNHLALLYEATQADRTLATAATVFAAISILVCSSHPFEPSYQMLLYAAHTLQVHLQPPYNT
jgi:hypothetical protein